jgi:hypothetical protein
MSVTKAAPQRKSSLISSKDLMAKKFEKPTWVVDNLLRLGRKRISLLAGWPESGKSNLARTAAICVAAGRPFLGRATLRSPVMLWQSEEDEADVQEMLQTQGHNPDTDEPIWIFKGDADHNNVDELREEMRCHRDVRLCIIETLDDLLKIEDLKENTASRIAFDKFDKAVVNEFYPTCSFLALHHLKKVEVKASTGLMLLGATVIRGRTDAKIYLNRVSDASEDRVIHASVRRGIAIPQTKVEWDKATENMSLGITLTEVRRDNMNDTRERVVADIRKFYANHPNTGKDACVTYLDHNTDQIKREHAKAVIDGWLVKTGEGKKGDKFLYSLKEIPVETIEEEFETVSL